MLPAADRAAHGLFWTTARGGSYQPNSTDIAQIEGALIDALPQMCRNRSFSSARHLIAVNLRAG